MILYGAGGHAHVVSESLDSSGKIVRGIIDDDQKIELFEKLNVHHGYSPNFMDAEELIIAIGSNKTRYSLSEIISHAYGICIDASSYFSRSAKIGLGSVLLAKSVIQSQSKVGKHVIVNTGAIVEHNCEIDDFAHIGPGSVVCGGVMVGKGVFIGANATILPGITIGDWAIIGAGSVVLKNVRRGEKVAGNPAKTITD